MHAVSDVNATRDRVVMTAEAGTEGRERGPFSRTDRPASARRPRAGAPNLPHPHRLREGNSYTREMRGFYGRKRRIPKIGREMTTEQAQRRLVEALATVRNTPGLDHGTADSPLSAVAIGLRFLASVQAEGGPEERAMSTINAAVADLCDAVNTEQKEASHG